MASRFSKGRQLLFPYCFFPMRFPKTVMNLLPPLQSHITWEKLPPIGKERVFNFSSGVPLLVVSPFPNPLRTQTPLPFFSADQRAQASFSFFGSIGFPLTSRPFGLDFYLFLFFRWRIAAEVSCTFFVPPSSLASVLQSYTMLPLPRAPTHIFDER